MNTVKYIAPAALFCIMASSCDSDLDKVVYDADKAIPAEIQDIPDEIILDAYAEGDEALKLTWTKPDPGFQAEVTNNLEMDIAGNEFSHSVLLTSVKGGDEYSITNAALNSKIMSLLEANEQEIGTVKVEFRITSSIASSTTPLFSNIVSTTITPYAGTIDYPAIWVIGDYCGWSHQNSQFLYGFTGDNVYQGVVDFGTAAANGFKITGVEGWEDDFNWGASGEYPSESSQIQLISGGASGNIGCYAKRFYHFSFDTSSLILTNNVSFNTMSVVGEAGSEVSGWGGQEIDMTFDSATQVFYADVTLTDGEIKFRADHDWSYCLGIAGEGCVSSTGENIPVTAGQYRIYLNMNNAGNMTYSLSTADFGK